MSRINYFTTGCLLDYLYHQNYYKLIRIDSSKQRNYSHRFIKTKKYEYSQQIIFVGKLEEDDGVTMFLLPKNSKKVF